jgi:hypothetical protein
MTLGRVWRLQYISRIRQRVEGDAVLPKPFSKYAILKTAGDRIAET